MALFRLFGQSVLWMLWAGLYRQSYFPELCELVRSLDAERIASGREPLDEVIAFQKAVVEKDYAEETDRKELVAYRLWETVWDLVFIWTHEACIRTIGEAIWDRRYPKSEPERVAYRISVYKSLMHDQTKLLRELIHNPFLPNRS